MIYTIISAIIIVILLTLIMLFIKKILRKNSSNLEGNYFYLIISALVLLIVYFTGITYNNNSNFAETLASAVTSTGKTFTFEIRLEYVISLCKNNPLYSVSYILSMLFVYFAEFDAIFFLLKFSLGNKRRVNKALRTNCDILIGNNIYNNNYVTSGSNVIVFLDNVYTKEDISRLYDEKVPYIKGTFSLKHLKNINFREKVNYNFISFEDETKNLNYFSVFKDLLSENFNKKKTFSETKRFFLHFELSDKNHLTIQNEISKEAKSSPFIDSFSRYELIARKFIMDYPITKFMPSTFFDYSTATIKNNCELNVIYFGFGKVNKKVHNLSIMNDQLCSIKDSKIATKKINYFAYDILDKETDKNENFYTNRFIFNKSKFDNDDFFPLPDSLCNREFSKLDINSEDIFLDFLSHFKKDSLIYNSILVSFGNDLDNIDYALKLKLLLFEEGYTNYHIFVRVKNSTSAVRELLKDEELTLFGDFNSIFNNSVIVKEDLMNFSKLLNNVYNVKEGIKLVDTPWYELPPIEQQSNLYSSLNIRLKLNLLGYDYTPTKEINSNKKELYLLKKLLFFRDNKLYSDFLFFKNKNITRANALSFQEHLRWNAFYLSSGYVPYKKSKIKYLGNYAFKKDDPLEQTHAAITTYEGLDIYHKYLESLINDKEEISKEERLLMVSTYKYDYDLINSFKKIFASSNYLLIDKKLHE